MKTKYSIQCEALDLKLLPHPKKSLKIVASELGEKYSDLFPKDLKGDITYFSAISYTIGSINKNNCLILPDEGLKNYKSVISTPLDIEHEKDKIVGFCLNAYLTNMKNNKILTEAEAQEILDSKGQVNVGVIMGVWPLNNPEVDMLVRENFDENSEGFNKIKLSFECYFNDFAYFVSAGHSDYPSGTIYAHTEESSDEMWAALKTNGGNGIYKGSKISICPLDSFIGGNGLVLNPANPNSMLTSLKEGDTITLQNITSEVVSSEPIIAEEAPLEQKEEIIDNKNEIKSVILNNEDNMSKENTPEIQVAAMAPVKVDSDFAEAMKVELDKKIEELAAKDAKVAELETNFKSEILKLQDELNSTKDALIQAQAEMTKTLDLAKGIQAQFDAKVEQLNVIEQKQAEARLKETVASRMAILSAFMTITDDNKAILEKECATASDEEFTKKVEFYKSISHKVVASETPSTQVDVKNAVQTAVSDTANEVKSVNIITSTPSPSLMEKFATAFNNVESLGFNLKR